MPAPVSVCMIVRDEEHQLPRCLASIRPFVSEVVVIDTGSTDRTIEVAKGAGADRVEVYTGCNDEEDRMLRFDLARKQSFALATQPWVMWVDADDVVAYGDNLKGLVARLNKEREDSPALATMPYEFSHDDAGRCNLLLERERLMTPKGVFEWRGWVHEHIVPQKAYVKRHADDVRVIHQRSSSKKKYEQGRNLRILEAQRAAEGDDDPRLCYYLGQELGYAGRIDEAIAFLSKNVERSGWDDERYMSAQLIATHLINRGEHDKAIDWGMKAILIHEDWGEAYFTVSKACYHVAERTKNLRWWQRCAQFAKDGLLKPPTKTSLFVNPLDRQFEIHRYLNVALSKTGNVKGAIESVDQALSVHPGDEQLRLNKRIYEEYEAGEDFKKSIARLASLGKITSSVRAHLETVQQQNRVDLPTTPSPSSPPGNPNPRGPKVEVRLLKGGNGQAPKASFTSSSSSNGAPGTGSQARAEGALDIVIYVGPSLEAWNPETAEKSGIGGSETAAIEVSKRLAKLGHKVRVYGDCSPRDGSAKIEGTFDGVQYLDHSRSNIQCDVLVSSRRPELHGPWKASVLWMHDTHYGDRLTEERAKRFNAIWTLSRWHRDLVQRTYPFLDPKKVLTTRNGIDLGRFEVPSNMRVTRDPHRAVYSSSPDRGLSCALEIWPRVRERVPDAEFHIYYGFDNWEIVAAGHEPSKREIARLKEAIEKLKGDGVVFHGRTPQKQLALHMLKSGVFMYPTWFTETSCIGAMEAQAAGMRIVTSPLAALNETVGERGVLVPGEYGSESFKARFVDEVVRAMEEPDEADRTRNQIYAREHFGWDALAKEWETTFRSLLGPDAPTTNTPTTDAHVRIEPGAPRRTGQIIHAILDEQATGGVVMDPRDLGKTETTGGGCRPAFLRLIKELPKYGHIVRAFSSFSGSHVQDGIEYLPISEIDRCGRPNVMWAYYDVRCLAGRSGMLRIGSHHTYQIYKASFFHIDVNTVPSEAALRVLKPFWAPWSDWTVLPNAVDDDVPGWDPVPGRVIYHTSPDRGLHHLLHAWPEIKRRVPHASLHVIGRGERWMKHFLNAPGVENSELGKRARALETGFEVARRAGDVVTMTDLPRAMVLRELSCASVFAFPCSVLAPSETFSMSTMECCKIGVPVVLAPADALEEIYKGHALLTPAPVEAHMPEFVDAVVSVLTDQASAAGYSALGKKLASNFTFERAGKVLDDIVCGRHHRAGVEAKQLLAQGAT